MKRLKVREKGWEMGEKGVGDGSREKWWEVGEKFEKLKRRRKIDAIMWEMGDKGG